MNIRFNDVCNLSTRISAPENIGNDTRPAMEKASVTLATRNNEIPRIGSSKSPSACIDAARD